MKNAALLTALALASSALVWACSSAPEQPIEEEPGVAPAPSVNSAPAIAGEETKPAAPAAPAAQAPDADAGTTADAAPSADGSAATPEGGTGGTVGTGNPGGRCKTGDTPEGEPNNTPDKATPFTDAVCGEVSDANDVDFAVMTLPANAKGFGWAMEMTANNIEYWVTVGGKRQKLSGKVPFEPGEKYLFEVRNTGTKKVGYRVDLTVK
jgi:hypothetical protein